MDRFEGYSPEIEALAHAGLQGLLAALPVVAWLGSKQTGALSKLFDGLGTGLAKVAHPGAGAPSTPGTAKSAMHNPIILGAAIIASSMTHGAWRGYHRSKAAHRQFRSHVERLADCEQDEPERRSEGSKRSRHSGGHAR
jgi:hypothetical protein